MRKHPLTTDHYYHILNRGNNKRQIFFDAQDFSYFLGAMTLFNEVESLGRTENYLKNSNPQELVSLVAYCLNPNHFHLILKQNFDSGIAKYMQKIATGYTMYFNKKYKNNGSLFQGRFKSILIENDGYLNHLSAYVNLNNKIHHINDTALYRSSWLEYKGQEINKICHKDIILNSFGQKNAYLKFAQQSINSTIFDRESNNFLEFC